MIIEFIAGAIVGAAVASGGWYKLYSDVKADVQLLLDRLHSQLQRNVDLQADNRAANMRIEALTSVTAKSAATNSTTAKKKTTRKAKPLPM